MVVASSNWWAFVIRGICAILFGVLTFIMPGMALVTLVLLWGAYALFDGVFNLFAAFRQGGGAPWWALLIEGVVSIAAGILTFAWPGLTALVLLWFIAGWALVTGVMEIMAAIRLRKHISGEWILALTGVVSIILGVLLLIHPRAGALAVVLWIGVYAVVFGALLISLGLRLHRLGRATDERDSGFPTGIAPSH